MEVSALQLSFLEVFLWERHEKDTYLLPGHVKVSVSEMCSSYGMSVLKRLYCINLTTIKFSNFKKCQDLESQVDFMHLQGSPQNCFLAIKKNPPKMYCNHIKSAIEDQFCQMKPTKTYCISCIFHRIYNFVPAHSYKSLRISFSTHSLP